MWQGRPATRAVRPHDLFQCHALGAAELVGRPGARPISSARTKACATSKTHTGAKRARGRASGRSAAQAQQAREAIGERVTGPEDHRGTEDGEGRMREIRMRQRAHPSRRRPWNAGSGSVPLIGARVSSCAARGARRGARSGHDFGGERAMHGLEAGRPRGFRMPIRLMTASQSASSWLRTRLVHVREPQLRRVAARAAAGACWRLRVGPHPVTGVHEPGHQLRADESGASEHADVHISSYGVASTARARGGLSAAG